MSAINAVFIPNTPAANPALALRVDLIDGQFDLSGETLAFMNAVRTEIKKTARLIVSMAPRDCDTGRLIAAVDSLQHTKNLFCDAAILGCEAEARKKRKLSDE